MATYTWNILDEDCADISDWDDDDIGTAVSEVDPAGQFRFDTNAGAAGNAYAGRSRILTSPPNVFSVEFKTYFDVIGTLANEDYLEFSYSTDTWAFSVLFATDGLYIFKTGWALVEVGTDIVKHGGSADWQTWRFKIDKSGGDDVAIVEVFLDDVSQGTFDCDLEYAAADGKCKFTQYGWTTDDMVSHYDYVKIGVEIEQKVLSGTFGLVGSVVRLPKISLSGVFTLTGVVSRLIKTTLSGVFGLTGTITKLPKIALAGVFGLTGTITKLPKIALAGTFDFTGTVGRLIKKTLSGVFTLTGTVNKLLKIALSGVLTFSGSIYFRNLYTKITKAISTYTKVVKDTATYTKIVRGIATYIKIDK